MAIKKSRCLRGMITALLACCTVMALSTAAFAEESEEALKDQGVEEINKAYDFTVDTSEDGVGASAGISSGGWASLGSEMSYMKFPEGTVSEDGEEGLWCYCIDISTSTEDGHKYSMTTLDAAGYYDKEAADRIRGILLGSYPNMGMDELEKAYELTDLKEQEAFMATQWIVWYYSNPEGLVEAGGGKYYPANIYKPSDYPKDTVTIWYDDEQGNEVRESSSNVVKLAKALDALAPASPYETEPANITFSKTIYKNKVVFDFGESAGIETLKNIQLSVKDKDGNEVPFTVKGTGIEVQYEDLSMAESSMELTISLEGTQLLSKDVYFFSPEGGRDASQSRVAVYGGTTPVASDASFVLSNEEFENAEEDPTDKTEPSGSEGDREGDSTEDSDEDTDVDNTPLTGDDSNMTPFAIAALMALGSAVATFFRRKRAYR